MTFDASVIIKVRNGAATIRRQLQALSAQRDAPPFEVIVVDNGSTDGTARVVQEWIDQGTGAVTDACVISAADRASIPYSCNVGASAASGRLLLFCDADDAVHPGWVGAMTAGLVGPGIAAGRVVAWRDGHPVRGLVPEGPTRTNYLPHVSGCNYAIDRATFLDIGGFDESLPVYGCEDVDIAWRAQENGHPLIHLPAAVVDFTVTPSTRAVKKTFRAAKARIAVAIRYPRSMAEHPITLRAVLTDTARQTLLLPLALARPGTIPRTRILRNVVASHGRLAGYWTYAIRKKPPQYLSRTIQGAQ